MLAAAVGGVRGTASAPSNTDYAFEMGECSAPCSLKHVAYCHARLCFTCTSDVNGAVWSRSDEGSGHGRGKLWGQECAAVHG